MSLQTATLFEARADILFQAAEEPLRRLPGVFLKQASAYYAKMDVSSLALLAGGLLDEMFETLIPSTPHAVNLPSAKVHAAPMMWPLCCGLLLLQVLYSVAGKSDGTWTMDCAIPWTCIKKTDSAKPSCDRCLI